MAHRAGSSAIYDVVNYWLAQCILSDGSVLGSGHRLWAVENIQELRTAFTQNPLLGDEKFEVKFHKQLANLPPSVIQLGAEMLWVLFLFPRKLIAAERKRELISTVWSWSGDELSPSNNYLSDKVLAGIGSAGTAFNTQRDRELEALIELVLVLKTSQDGLATGDPWRVAEQFDEVSKASKRNIRNILLHLLFPTEFERIASPSRKREIVRALSERPDAPDWARSAALVDIDRELLAIRRRLESASPRGEIDFYSDELRAQWEKGSTSKKLSDTIKLEDNTDDGAAAANEPARDGVALAQHLAERAGLAQFTPDLLLAALLSLPDRSSPAAAALGAAMRVGDTPPVKRLLEAYGIGVTQPSDLLAQPWPASPLIAIAMVVRETVASGQPQPLSPRHLFAVLLTPGPNSAIPTLERLGYDPAELRRVLLGSIERRRIGERLDRWRDLLGPGGTPEIPVYAGFSGDALPADESRRITRDDDRLGVMRDVTALAEVLGARKTSPPLAVGLFGDWGTGKSFFMELLRQDIERLGKENPDFYCERVVQVWFNAWHYMESNLWASLAARVFEELAGHLASRTDLPSAARDALFERLQESQGVLAEAVSERKEADARLAQIRDAREAKEASFSATAATAIRAATATLSADPEIQHKLREAKDRLGLSAAQADVAAAEEQVRQLRSLGGRIAALGGALRRRPMLLGVGFAIFVAVVLVTPWVLDHYTVATGPARILATAAAWLAGLAAGVAPAAKWVSRGVAWLEDVATRLRQARDAEQRQEEMAIEREVTRLRDREREAEAQVAALTREIDELRAGRRLQRFIVERHASAEYRQHLGLVNLIRHDFEQLSRLLTEAGSETDAAAPVPPQADGSPSPAPAPLPRIDRIILYIDDLDRCPEDRVVQVLQAVHLLLAFPLFVVVVGVDSRWLLLSLEDHYATLRGKSTDGHDAGRGESEWNTTPQNYLEKIFQIPFTLRPMEAAGFHSLVETLLPVATGDGQQEPDGDTDVTSGTPTAGDGESTTDRTGTTTTGSTGGDSQDAEMDAVTDDDDEEENGDDEDIDDEQIGPIEEMPPPPRPNPQGLTVEKHEREFIRMLHPLIASPRALKRFTNVYRFLRVQQRGAALDGFRGTADKPGEFQVAALLLAAVVGYPAEATGLLRAVLTRRDRSWWDLVESLDTSGAEADAALRAEADPHAAERQRMTLREALQEVRSAGALADYPHEAYARWAREVARFSFQSGRILSFREQPPTEAEVA